MAAKKGTKSNGAASFGGYVFVNYTLSSDDKKKLATFATSQTFDLTFASRLVLEGYKFSLSYDDKNGSHVCTITDTREDSPFHKHMLSGRGSSSLNAYIALCYKHFSIAGEDWANIAEAGDRGSGDFG